MSLGKGHSAVRAQKRPRLSDGQPWQKLEFFPTPPWATRALPDVVLPMLGVNRDLGVIWEPCAGLRHMADPLSDYGYVLATDIHLYSSALDVERLDFLAGDRDSLQHSSWIITNPPFTLAAQIVRRALCIAAEGVAMLLRLQWLESGERFKLFSETPPSLVAIFSERVPMCEGGWDPALSTATAYAWFVWVRGDDGWPKPAPDGVRFNTALIPPVCKATLSRPSDVRLAARFMPGWIAPSTIKTAGRDQGALDLIV